MKNDCNAPCWNFFWTFIPVNHCYYHSVTFNIQSVSFFTKCEMNENSEQWKNCMASSRIRCTNSLISIGSCAVHFLAVIYFKSPDEIAQCLYETFLYFTVWHCLQHFLPLLFVHFGMCWKEYKIQTRNKNNKCEKKKKCITACASQQNAESNNLETKWSISFCSQQRITLI